MKLANRIVLACAAVGFLLPIVMLIYYSISQTAAGSGFVAVCPSCMASMALDRSSTSTAIIVWLLICLSNAVLYAIPAGCILYLGIAIRRQFGAGKR